MVSANPITHDVAHEDETPVTRERGASTRAVHGGTQRTKAFNALHNPIVQTATYTFEKTQDVIDFMDAKAWGGGEDREEYGRYGNPTVTAVEKKLAASSIVDPFCIAQVIAVCLRM
ncbi:MAG: PLP-dependent transferase [Chloroflexota bacterium]